MECPLSCNILSPAHNKDNQVLYKSLKPNLFTPKWSNEVASATGEPPTQIRLTKLIACDYTAAAYERPKRWRDPSPGRSV